MVIRRILLAAAMLLSLSAQAQIAPRLATVQGTSRVNSTFTLNFTSGCTITPNGTEADLACNGVGGGTVGFVDAPLAGDGSAGNHLTCALCTTASPTAIGDLLYSTSGTQALSPLADVAAGSYLRSGGVASPPLWSTLTLPNSATTGDILYATAANIIGNLADVAVGQVLVSGGIGVAPSWGSVPSTAVAGVVYSDGSDGAMVFDGTNTFTNVTKNSSTLYTLNGDIYPTNMTVNSGVTVFTNGYRIVGTGTLTIIAGGHINHNGNPGNVGTGGANLTGGTLGAGTGGTLSGGGSAGGTTGGGGTNGLSGSTNGYGGNGGNGGNAGSGGIGGTGGVVTGPAAANANEGAHAQPMALFGYAWNGSNAAFTPFRGGAGGGGGGSSAAGSVGGGGGSGGGVVIIAFPTMVLNGDITATGGAGAAASGTGTGGGGGGCGGGLVELFYHPPITGTFVPSQANCTAGGAGGGGVSTGATGSPGVQGKYIPIAN